jgi:hypothetical protein
MQAIALTNPSVRWYTAVQTCAKAQPDVMPSIAATVVLHWVDTTQYFFERSVCINRV